MRVRGFISLIILAAVVTTAAHGQSSAKVVKAKPESESYKVRRGASLTGAVVIDIEDGYHINSNKPLDKFLIATSLKVDAQPGVRLTRIVYPKSKLQKFAFSEKPMSVYEGRAILKFTARVSPTMATGNHKLRGKLTVQACNNEVCLRPQTVNVDIPVEVIN